MSSVAFVAFIAASLFGTDAAVALTSGAHHTDPLGLFDDDPPASTAGAASRLMRGESIIAQKTQNVSTSVYTGKNATVNVHLFYETRCPDCIEFINGTLAPLWRNKEMRSRLNITMNPYGNAMSLPVEKVSAGYKWWHPETTKDEWAYVHICQHGNDECLGNLIQTCAAGLAEQGQFMEMVFCMADRSGRGWGIEKSSYECMQKHNIDAKQVKECVESPQGNKLFADYGKITSAVEGRQGTPWVLINGAALANPAELERTVCTHILVQEPTMGQEPYSGPESCKPYMKEIAGGKGSGDSGAPAPASDTFTVLTKKQNRELIALDRRHI